MAVVKFYDAMGAGVDMDNRDFTYVEANGNWVQDGPPYIEPWDWDTDALTYSFNDGAIYETILVSEISDPIYVLESVYYDNEFFEPLADFYRVDVRFNADNGYGDAVTFAKMLWGDDTLTGNNFSDTLRGGTGNDLVEGLRGNDLVDGGRGADDMYGDSGNDTYFVDNVFDRVFETPTATSTIDSGGTDTVRAGVSFTLGRFVENLVLTGTSAIDGSGNTLANRVSGNSAANTLNGLLGNDQLRGAGGNDVLVGGAGQDSLTGGAGSDVFDFNAASESRGAARDVIADFASGSDRIDLSTIDANVASAGNDAFTGFIGASEAFTAAGQLKFSGGVLYGNTDADGAAEFSIALTGVTALGGADVVL